MNLTNLANLPKPLVDALTYSDYDQVGDISITGLIQSPRARLLTARHDSEITQDVSDLIWRLIGSIGHKILERADTTNHLAEERLTQEVLGWRVSGKPDLLGPDGVLDDYKFTSVYAFLFGDKREWEQQLNCYTWLYRKHGFEVTRTRIIAVLRDWSKRRAERESDYPPIGVIVKEIPLWPEAVQEMFVETRVILHQEAAGVPDSMLPQCSNEETWKRPDVWAVRKKGNKRALPGGLHSTEESAQVWSLLAPHATEIEFRPGAYPRCESYCLGRDFCNQFGAVKSAAASEEDT